MAPVLNELKQHGRLNTRLAGGLSVDTNTKFIWLLVSTCSLVIYTVTYY